VRSPLCILAVAILSISVVRLHAQLPGPTFRRIDHDHGLSQSLVQCVLQDRNGFMWIGTEDGLNRYDGCSFTTYRHDPLDSTTLSSSHVWSLYEDRNGLLWIGTWGGGLNCLDPIRQTVTRYVHNERDTTSIAHDRVASISGDSSGALWVCTAGGGLDRFDPAKRSFKHITAIACGLPPAQRKDLFCSRLASDGSLWVGTYFTGLLRIDPRTGAVRQYRHDARDAHSLSDDRILSLCEDADGRLWVGTWDGGLNRLDPASGDCERFVHDPGDPGSLPGNIVRTVYVAADRTLWVGTIGGGAARKLPHESVFSRIVHSPSDAASLGDDVVTTILQDAGGTMWFGTASGISVFAPTAHKFPLFKSARGIGEGLRGKRVYALATDSSQTVWIGTEDGGLHRFDPRLQRFRQYTHSPTDLRSLPNDYVTSIMTDSHGEIWVGTYGGGLVLVDRRRMGFRRMGTDNASPAKRLNSYISALLEDSHGNIWVGTWIAGLAVIDRSGNVLKKYIHRPDEPGSIPDNDIRCLALDRNGTVWVGTAKGGLSRYDAQTDTFSRMFPTEHGALWAGTEYIQSIMEDAQGRLWLGTFGGGAVCFDPAGSVHRRLTRSNGLPNNVVYGILADGRHRLWMSTNEGIVCYDPAQETFRSYSRHDGLQADEFNFNAFCRGPRGALYFGGVNGFNIIEPEQIPENRHIPPVVITGFRMFDAPLRTAVAASATEALTLGHDANFLSVEYASLDYALPERNQYSYRLEGIDPDWVRAGTRRTASYTNLPPGSYVFRVRGSNNDGVWNEAGAVVAITVLPPYWQTVWFRAIAGILLVTAMSFLYRLRVRSLLKVERLRLRIASDLHDDIGSNLASIAVLADLVRTRATLGPVESGRLQDISSAARSTSEALRDIVWFVNPEHDNACTIVDRLRGITATLLAGVDHSFQVEEPLPSIRLPMAFRRDLALMYKEILSNIVRHASASHVRVRFAMLHGRFRLMVSDDGRGFDTGRPSEGNGLLTMKRRAGAMGGSLAIQSEEGKGTTITLEGKIP
jgi:ligand-binding sensor domain-containing protein/signal transduction histidine kinase